MIEEKIVYFEEHGATAVTPADNALNTRIVHGVAPGQLQYSGTEIYGLLFVNPNGSFKIRRYFTNGSGGDVTAREVGIYQPGQYAGSTVAQFLTCRDVRRRPSMTLRSWKSSTRFK